MASHTNEYSAQLQEIFASCDGGEKGYLREEELKRLCSKLQIDHFYDKLLRRLSLGKPDLQVQFAEFKSGFLAVLQQAAADDTDSESEDEQPPSKMTGSPDAVMPKYVLGSKRYGRRSKPNVTDEELAACLPLDFSSLPDMEDDDNDDNGYINSEDSTLGSTNRHLSSSSMSDKDTGPGFSKRRKKSTQESKEETYEADGQLNLSLEQTGAEDHENLEHFHDIWRSLNVGRNGYLVLDELGKVCKYIGMEMGHQDLVSLFENLDVDRDGRVGFEEFVEGLFHHRRPQAVTPRPPSAQRKMRQSMAVGPEERNVTPSIITAGTPMMYFTSIDPHNTGFAKASDIVELWERMNIPQAPEVLMALGFSLDRKISLAELSLALEQELAVEDTSSVHQAAIISFQQELHSLRSEVEHACGERDKLRLDLQEANARNTLLAREGDERQASMEKSSEMRVLIIEKRYQEEVQNLRAALEEERETHSSTTARLRQSLQSKMEDIRHEEARMKEHLQQAQKEIERLEHDLMQSNERLSEERKSKMRLQNKLDAAEMAHRQLAERDASTLHVSAQVEQSTLAHLQQLEAENKRLKDTNDELEGRLVQLRQEAEMGRSKLQSQGSKGALKATRIPVREGSSALSDSGRSSGRRRSILSMSSDASELDDEGSPPERRNRRMRRKLPGTPSMEEEALSSGEFEGRGRLGINAQELLERERKELEHAFRIEVAGLEEKQAAEKADILKNFDLEKKKLLADCERRNQERLAQMTQELTNSFALEKRDLVQKHESEKNLMEVKFAEERKQIEERVQKEAEIRFRKQIAELQASLERERTTNAQQASNERRSRAREKELQESLRKEKEEVRRSYELKLADLEANLSKERTSIAELRMRNSDLHCRMQVQENDLKHDFDADKRKLREEFEEEKQALREAYDQERSRLQADVSRCRKELQSLREENSTLCQDLQTMKNELEEEFHRETDALLRKYAAQNDKADTEVTRCHKTIAELQQAKADLELQLQQQEEEMRLSWRAEQEELQQQAQLNLLQTEAQHRQEIQAFNNMLTGGVACLHGKLREDFFAILQQEKEKEVEQERDVLRRKLQEEETELVARLQQEKNSLRKTFDDEKLALMEKYEGEIKDLNGHIRELRKRLDQEHKVLAETMEKDRARREDSLSESVKKTLEAEYVSQLEQMRTDLQRERAAAEKREKQAEARAAHLQEALESASQETQLVRQRNDQLLSTVDQLRANVQTLERVKEELEAGRMEAESRSRTQEEALQRQVEELLQEKDLAVAVKSQTLQTVPSSQVEVSCLREEKAAMERELATVRGHLDQVQAKLDFLQALQGEDPVQRLEEERGQLQDQISGLQAKLSESRKLQQELLRIQEDYSQLRQEKAELEALVNERQQSQHHEPQQQQQQQQSAPNPNHMEDANNAENDQKFLENKLQSQKLLEASLALETAQTQLAGELSAWRARGWARGDGGEGVVDLETYTRLQLSLVEQQRSVRNLQDALRQRDTEVTQILKGLDTDWRRRVGEGEADRKELKAKLELKHKLLKEQTEKLKEALETSTRRNLILKDLYLENAELMKSLQTSEERHRAAQRRVLQQEKQCRALQRTLHKIYKAGLAGWPSISPAATAPL